MDFNDFVFVRMALRLGQAGRFVKMHELCREPRGGPESSALGHRRGAISGFFFQLAERTLQWILTIVKGAGRNLQQLLSGCVAVLPNENHLFGRGPGNNTYRSGMNDDLARTLIARRLDDPVFPDLDMAAFVCDAAAQQFGFAHTCCASRIGLKARTNLSICFSVMMNGGSRRKTVSCVQLRMNPCARSCFTISLPEIFSSTASIKPSPRTSFTTGKSFNSSKRRLK